MAHRLAWFLVYGRNPKGEIDHINGNPSDNRICNLRECTRSQNVMNTRRGNGVCWHKTKKKWQALVKSGGKSHFLGHFDTREEAEEFLRADPFSDAGLFGDVTISRWKQAFLDRTER